MPMNDYEAERRKRQAFQDQEAEKTAELDLRDSQTKHAQWINDWATPMWAFVVIDTVCLLLGPLARADFAMSAAALRQYRFVTILSAFFMHANWFHLSSDLFMMIILSVILDSIPISRYVTVLMYVGGGIVCNLLVLPFIFHTPILVMGSSGGVATLDGMTIALTGILVLRHQKITRMDANHVYGLYGWKLLLSAVFMMTLLDTNLYQISPDAFYLHLFGLILGLIAGVMIYKRTDL